MGQPVGNGTCLLTYPRAVESLLWSPYRPPKLWPKTNRLPVISPGKKKKKGSFRTSRELQFKVCNYGEPTCKSPHGKGRRTLLLGGKGSWEGYSKKESMAFHWLSSCQERRGVFLLPVQLCCCHRV